jgi:Ca-activated chloride channel family protein
MLDIFNDITFAAFHYVWLFLIIPIIIAFWWWRNNQMQAEIKFSDGGLIQQLPKGWKVRLRWLPYFLRLITISALIVVLMRPQSRSSWKETKTEGIDIVLAIDVSYSMLAKDFKPNRLEVAKELAIDFINERPNDRIGLVIFSGEAFTACPLTTDHTILSNLLQDLQPGQLESGTAIGSGLATAVARIKDSKAKSKVIILLTDGVSNAGEIAPVTAGEIAKTFSIRTYSIGIGSYGKALTPVVVNQLGNLEYDYVNVEIDEPTMKKISALTNGKYFRAADKKSLGNTLKEIDRMEKSFISEKSFTNKSERYLPFALLAVACFLLEFLCREFIFRNTI